MLEDHDINPTAQRIDIARLLFQKPQHLSADDILSCVNESAERVSKATVYNTLGLFVKKGVLREVIIDPERIFYDSNTAPHFHIYNRDTGELSDIHGEELEVRGVSKLSTNLNVESVEVIIRVRGS